MASIRHKYKLFTSHLFINIYLPLLIYLLLFYFIIFNDIFYQLILNLKKVESFNSLIQDIPHFNILNIVYESGVRILFFIFISLYFLYLIRKVNSSRVFRHKDYLLNYPPIIFKISKILGFKSIDISRIPIPILFYCKLSNIYVNYQIGDVIINPEDIIPLQSCNVDVSSEFKIEGETVNLLLEDSFQFHPEELERLTSNSNFVYIKRNSTYYHGREYCLDFTKVIQKSFHLLRKEYSTINLYLTTNPRHNISIISNIITPDDRDEKVTLTVFFSEVENSKHIYNYGLSFTI